MSFCLFASFFSPLSPLLLTMMKNHIPLHFPIFQLFPLSLSQIIRLPPSRILCSFFSSQISEYRRILWNYHEKKKLKISHNEKLIEIKLGSFLQCLPHAVLKPVYFCVDMFLFLLRSRLRNL